MSKELNLVEIKSELDIQLSDKETLNTLLATTFKGLQAPQARQAALEGMMRGFTFTDFLQKNIYAVPFGGGYSLVTSIDYARKIGARSGIVGKKEPVYEEQDGKVISCSVTVQKMTNGHLGEFTAKVFFAEYNTSRNQWVSKPRTMIAKVAEMHVLRMACPEEMAQSYIEEEYQKEEVGTLNIVSLEEYKKKLEDCKNIAELQKVWGNLPGDIRKELISFKDEIKSKYADTNISNTGGVDGSTQDKDNGVKA